MLIAALTTTRAGTATHDNVSACNCGTWGQMGLPVAGLLNKPVDSCGRNVIQ